MKKEKLVNELVKLEKKLDDLRGEITQDNDLRTGNWKILALITSSYFQVQVARGIISGE